MPFTPLKIAIAALWLAAVGAIAVLMPVTTRVDWITVVGFGLMPSVFMLRAWRRPAEALSETIQTQIRQ